MDDDLLDYRLSGTTELIDASVIKRALNYTYDLVFLAIILMALQFVGVYVMILFVSVTWMAVLILFVYFVVIEIVMNGRSIGKYFTKTRVVSEHGYKPDISAYIIRGIGRIIPLSAISLLFGNKKTYYDMFSKTRVIDETLSKI
jgi:uncharacterized RDD family membrane protein YckC